MYVCAVACRVLWWRAQWRRLATAAAEEAGDTWRCAQHPDPRLASCDAPEEEMGEDEEWEAEDEAGEEDQLVLEAVEVRSP